MSRADCTVKALAAALAMSFEQANAIAEAAGRKNGRRLKSSKLIAEAKLAGHAFRKLRMKPRTLRRFMREHPLGRYYVRSNGHALAVVNGRPSDLTTPFKMIVDAWEYQPSNDIA